MLACCLLAVFATAVPYDFGRKTGVLFCFIYVPPIAVQSTSHTETTARVALELPKMTSTTVLALCKQFEEYSFKQESPFIIFVILQFEGVPPAEMNEIDFRT